MIISVQYLRGIAALMVVYHHISFQLAKAQSDVALPLASLGAAGVDIFFVISGFIMWIATRSAELTPAQFLHRRIIRVVPLYWAVTAFLFAVAYGFPNLLGATEFNPPHALWSLFFIPVQHPRIDGEILPFFIQGWTLNYEMFFYAVFALAMAINRAAMFAIIAVALGAFAAAGLVWTPENAILKFYASTLLFEFIGGMGLGWLYLRATPAPRPLAWLLIALGAAALITTGLMGHAFGPNGAAPERGLLWGLPSLAIVAGAVYLANPRRSKGSGPLWALGESSYSLYLTHLITLPALALIWRQSHLGFEGLGAVGYVIAALVISALAGWVSFVCFERPVTARLRDGGSNRRDQDRPDSNAGNIALPSREPSPMVRSLAGHPQRTHSSAG
jgi:exopolysaccharide production protein ExoZ